MSTVQLPSDADITGRDLGEEELKYLREVIESGTLNCTKGTQVKAFESAFAARWGVPHARAVTSGTAAIHTAIAAVDPEPGDEIINTPITDIGGLAPILYQQAIPIFADVDPVSLNVTAESVAARITPRTKATSPRISSGARATSSASARWPTSTASPSSRTARRRSSPRRTTASSARSARSARSASSRGST
jgi:dTDP-4-amino-4,6-dideoxygalactose transaminase